MHAIVDALPVDEDHHVLAQRRLVVEHVGAGAGIAGERRLERLAHGAASTSTGGQAMCRCSVGVKLTRTMDGSPLGPS